MSANSKPKRYPLIEWASAAIGLMIIAIMVGLLAVEAIRDRGGVPPILEAKVAGLVASRGGYVLEIDVFNGAHATAASVQIEGVLKQGEADVETSNASVAYVPGESHRRAAIVFTRDPRDYRLELRVTGFERP